MVKNPPASVGDVGSIPISLVKEMATQSLVAQTVKRLPAMWETRVRSLGGKDPLEKEMATHSSTLENSMDRGAL